MAKINIEDLIIDTYFPSIPKPEYEMWITHIPTRLRIFGTGVNKRELKESLIEKLQDMVNAKS